MICSLDEYEVLAGTGLNAGRDTETRRAGHQGVAQIKALPVRRLEALVPVLRDVDEVLGRAVARRAHLDPRHDVYALQNLGDATVEDDLAVDELRLRGLAAAAPQDDRDVKVPRAGGEADVAGTGVGVA